MGTLNSATVEIVDAVYGLPIGVDMNIVANYVLDIDPGDTAGIFNTGIRLGILSAGRDIWYMYYNSSDHFEHAMSERKKRSHVDNIADVIDDEEDIVVSVVNASYMVYFFGTEEQVIQNVKNMYE